MPLEHSEEELAAWLRLTMEPGLGTLGAISLLHAYSAPEPIFNQAETALRRHLTPELARQIAAPPTPEIEAAIAQTGQWLRPADRHIVTLADARYPPALLNISDPPLLLYVEGDPHALTRPAIAIVGARSATADGLDHARSFARYLASQGWCVISGLALGIDAAAHEGALAAAPAGAGTIAVMGTGLDIVYPRRHHSLAQRIAASGALVSEYPLGTPALPHHFPQRNRLVAGLTRGVLVVEAARQSGSLITARLAAENGREVFAIPGSVHSPLSRGCHDLIRQGAKLVETARDITEELGAPAGPRRSPAAGMPASGWDAAGAVAPARPRGWRAGGGAVSDASGGWQVPGAAAPTAWGERQHAAGAAADPVLAALGYDPVHMDTLLARTGMPVSALAARLLDLELAGAVQRLEGGHFQRRRPGQLLP